MSEKTRYADWPTLAEAAADLQISEKTIRRAGVELRHRPAPGRTRPETVVNPRDLQRFMEPAHVMPEAKAPPPAPDRIGTGADSEPAAAAEKLPVAVQLAELDKRRREIERTLAAIFLAPRPEPPRPWLTVDEAATVSGLTAGYLRRLARAGEVHAVRGGPRGALRIRRASLEAFAG